MPGPGRGAGSIAVRAALTRLGDRQRFVTMSQSGLTDRMDMTRRFRAAAWATGTEIVHLVEGLSR